MRFKHLILLAVVFLIGLSFLACSSDSNDEPDGDAGDGDIPDGDLLDGDRSDGDAPDGDTPGGLGEPVDETFGIEGLTAEVNVAWDEFGVPHIYAANEADAMRAMGWIQADQRMVEAEFLRKYARGRLTELVQAIPDLVTVDLFYRGMFALKDGGDLLQAIWDMMDDDVKDLLQAHADGFNARLAKYKEDDSDWPAPFDYFLILQGPDKTVDWEPLDTIAIGRLQSWQLARTLDEEITYTMIHELLPDDLFNALVFSEPTIPLSIMPHADSVKSNTVSPQYGTRHGEALLRKLTRTDSMLDKIRVWEKIDRGASNNWAVARQSDGIAYLCNDPHLALQTPSVFIPMTVDVKELGGDDQILHAGGIGFPGTPAFIIGRNDKVAWALTTTNYDVQEVYEEQVTFNDDDEPVSVLFNGNQVDVNKVVQQLQDGHGANPETVEEPLYFVPHHGFLLPDSFDTESGTALSTRWTGMEPTLEIQAVANIQKAQDINGAFAALQDFKVGAQNYVFTSIDGEIAYNPHVAMPIRQGDLAAHPPWMVQPGTGEYEWDGYVAEDKLPTLRNPDDGFIITANNDIMGSTLDNDALNEEWYSMFSGAAGYRAYTIKKRLQDKLAGGDVSFADMEEIQNSYVSEMATDLVPMLLAIADNGDNSIMGDLSNDALAGLQLLEDWNFKMASGIADDTDPTGSAAIADIDEQSAAAAATFFNFLLVRLAHDLIADELTPYSINGLPSTHTFKVVFKMVKDYVDGGLDPKGDYVSPLFDNIDTAAPNIESPEDILRVALENTVEDITTNEIFTGTAISDAYWGRIHTLTMEHPLSSMTSDYNVGPFGLGGGPFTVNVASYGVGFNVDTESYTFGSGPSLRIIHAVSEAGFETEYTIPGGVDGRMDSEHFLDMFDLWKAGERTKLLIAWDEVKAAGYTKITALVPSE